MTRRRRAASALGSAPAGEVLESAFAGLVPRRLGGLVAVTVDQTGPHLWSAASWLTLPGSAGDAAAPVFQIGSVTKVFTALLLARAVASGDVEMDDPIDIGLAAGLRVSVRPMTFRHLVTHRAGLPKVPRGMRGWVDRADPYRTADDVGLRAAAAAAGDHVRHGRDAPIRYSNFGFALLGLPSPSPCEPPGEQALAERGPGAGRADLVRRAAGRATGRRPGPARRARSAMGPCGIRPGGRAVVSTGDLATWLALLTDAVRPDAGPAEPTDGRSQVVEAIRTTLVPRARSPLSHVGMAWQLFERDGVAWHNGGVLGAASFVGVDMPHARAIGVFAIGNPRPDLDRAAIRALTSRR